MPIPGVTTSIRDRFYTVARQEAASGPRIVAIAKRSTATGTGGVTDLDVVRATAEYDVITAFGLNSDLHRAFVELVIAGAEKIFLVPLPSNTVFVPSTGAVTSGGVDIFQAAFDAAEAAVPDIIIPWGRGGSPTEWESPATPSNEPEFGFYADNTTAVSASWAVKVATATKAISENTNPCLSVLGVKPFVGLAGLTTSSKMTPGQVAQHLALPNLASRDGGSAFKDVGPYLVVVAAEVLPINYGTVSSATPTTTDWGFANGAAQLAATLSRTSSYTSLVAKPLYNIDSIRYAPTRVTQNSLSDRGVNAVAVNFNRIPVFSEGLTYAQSNSDYTRLSTKRIIDEATQVVRQVCQKFIGQPSTIEVRNSLDTAITSGLRGMQLLGALLGSEFTVTYIPNQNKAIVDLVLTPAFELKTIEVQVAISL